jgi:hypothetical protein
LTQTPSSNAAKTTRSADNLFDLSFSPLKPTQILPFLTHLITQRYCL